MTKPYFRYNWGLGYWEFMGAITFVEYIDERVLH